MANQSIQEKIVFGLTIQQADELYEKLRIAVATSDVLTAAKFETTTRTDSAEVVAGICLSVASNAIEILEEITSQRLGEMP